MNNVKVGMSGTVKVGRNQVNVTILAPAPNGGWKVKTESGKGMTVKTITPNGTPAAKAQVTTSERRESTKPVGEKRLSLVNAAAAVLEASEEALSVRQMIEYAKTRGLWMPGSGKTPEQTLYSSILREIKEKGEASRFVRVERGRFAFRRA